MNSFYVALTPAQHSAVEWAADAMVQFWQDKEEREAEGSHVVENPVVMSAHGCAIAPVRGVLEDLKYRLTEQLTSMTDDLPTQQASGQVRTALNAWARIEEEARKAGFSDIEAR